MQEYLHIGHANDLTKPSDRRLYRALEIMPGFLAWGTIIIIIGLSFILPVWMAFFIIAFDIYWLLKTIYLSLHMRASFNRMRAYLKRDWLEELRGLPPASGELNGTSWKDMYHLIILPMYKEPLAIVQESITSLTKINYPLDHLIVVLAVEERGGLQALATAQAIQKEFENTFFKFKVFIHPDGLPGEIAGKGSNEVWAGQKIREEFIDPQGIAYEKIIVSVFDIDTVVPPDFFACLTWHFFTSEKPFRSSFQPIPLFTNNIWEAPAFARVFAFSTTFWQMIQQARPERLVTFSSQSVSFKALVEVGFWQKNMVSEDSRIFWQFLLRYDGDWRTVPLYYPVYMDANVAPTFWQTVKNQYKQIRRWHFGVENNPYFLFGFIKNRNIGLAKKLHISIFTVENSHSAATNSLIIFLGGWLPILVGNVAFSQNILSYNLVHITEIVMNLAMFGLVTTTVLSMLLLPPRPPKYGRLSWIWMVLQWVLLPINLVIFGAIPALDAQTRLMFGKYLGFWVTPKIRKQLQESYASTQSATNAEIPTTAASTADTSSN
jgi:hypothetical protein